MAFNIRVYGILINEDNEVLLSDERRFGQKFTKFPGGGLELGEGIKDCLIREFKEELEIVIDVGTLFYLTDFYQKSAFGKNDQIISVYYFVLTDQIHDIKTSKIAFDFSEEEVESHRWKKIEELKKEELTFPIDQLVAKMLIDKNH